MNLNYRYDKNALMALINSADESMLEHNLVIDFDGEVIIDPEKRFPNAALSAYKFCTKIKDKTLHSNMMISALYDALEIIFNKLNSDSNYSIDREEQWDLAA
jgi:hypothetical protein